MHDYCHTGLDGQTIDLPLGKIVCVGRNYLAHIQELNNAVPDEALLFIKPSTALCDVSKPVKIPKDKGECHNEVEVAVLINKVLKNTNVQEAQDAIWGYGLALDLTLRDVQSELKSKGHPWERAKSFDGSCPLSVFVPATSVSSKDELKFSLQVNEQLRQQGYSRDMMRDIVSLLVEISHTFTLLPGDVILTGTPEGVAQLRAKDMLCLSLDGFFSVNTEVV
jgi:2-keto-4-pentenoate hydratase/2-oxohepta-3-ene-1,7-dioic acid hydratase in catechol pathway